jgi:putative transposase
MYWKTREQEGKPVSMAQICAQFGVSRQAHYQKLGREAERQTESEIILEMVRQVRRKHPRMGGRKVLFKIQPMLACEGLTMGRDRLFELLRSQDLLVKPTKTRRRTTIPGFWRAPNLLPGLVISRPDQVWVCDITYLEVELGRFVYLFVLMDLFSRFIVGWHVASSLVTDGALASLRMAIQQRPPALHSLIHHSDHGVQYTSHAYMDTLLQHHIRPSMGAIGNCYDNIFAERVIGILKSEYRLDGLFVDLVQVNLVVHQAVDLYNTDRPHLALNLAAPSDVYFGRRQDVPSVVVEPPPMDVGVVQC